MALRSSLLARWVSQIRPLNPTPSSILRTGNLSLNFRPSQANTIHRAFSARTPLQNQLLSASHLRSKGPSAVPWNLHRQGKFRRFFNSTGANHSEQPASLSQRLKKLSREYGWSALWIYLFLSALDFPICFAAVRLLGTDTIGHYEHVVVESVKGAIDSVWPGLVSKVDEEKEKIGEELLQIAEEEKKKNGDASLWTQLALAYAVHKSLIFIRVPLTAAITPKVVKILRQWGWDIVKGKPKGM